MDAIDGAGDRDDVAGLDAVGACGDELVGAALHPRHAHLVGVAFLELADGLAATLADAHRDALQLGAEGVGARCDRHEALGDDDGDQHAEHAERVGERVPDDGEAALVGIERRLGSRERRRVGEAPGVEACGLGAGEAEHVAEEGGDRCERTEQEADEPEDRQARAEEPRELRSGRQTDAVGEQRQPDDADDRGDDEPIVDRRRGDSGEQRSGRPDADPSDADRPDQGPDGEHDAQEHQRLICEQVEHRD